MAHRSQGQRRGEAQRQFHNQLLISVWLWCLGEVDSPALFPLENQNLPNGIDSVEVVNIEARVFDNLQQREHH